MGVHDGHRKRLKEEFLTTGLEQAPEHRMLELLLCYAIPQGDVNPLAHRLIDAFGSLAGVLDAPVSELMEVGGVGEHTAVLLKLVPATAARYLQSRAQSGEIVKTTEDFRRLLEPYFFGLRDERMCVVCLDAKYKLLCVRVVSDGDGNELHFSVPKVLSIAYSARASILVIAHNHPSGVAVPSREDFNATKMMVNTLRSLGIILEDHLIFADDEMISMRESSLIEGWADESKNLLK